MNYARKPTISNPVIIVIRLAHSQLFHKEAGFSPICLLHRCTLAGVNSKGTKERKGLLGPKN